MPLVLSVLLCNALQMASVVLYPFSARLFRRANREIANAWWSSCDLMGAVIYDIEFVITGDELPHAENAMLVVNHQSMADITTLFRVARNKGRLGDLKWFVKDPLKYVPGVGWGMVFLDCIFLKRDWQKDQKKIERTFGKFKKEQIPIWTISFVEGTRIQPHKVERAQRFAKERNLPILEHVLVPRTKGFSATMHGLRDHLDAVYDTTIGYDDGVPTLWQWVKGYVRRVHIHIERHPTGSLPLDDNGLKEWLVTRFQEKDARLAAFYEKGSLDNAAQ